MASRRRAALPLDQPAAPSVPAVRCVRPLFETVALDALAARFDLELARAFLRDAVTRGGTPEDPDDVRAVSAHIRGPFRNSIASRIGPQAANAIACSAEALMSGLQPDRLLRIVPPSRGPWLLVSDRDTGCPFVRDVRRVTNIVDLLIETDALPRATIVIDARCTPIELVTMAAMLEDLADTIQVVLVGASQGDAETFRSLAGRAVTFTDVYEPLALDRRAPRRSEPIPKMRAPRRPRKLAAVRG